MKKMVLIFLASFMGILLTTGAGQVFGQAALVEPQTAQGTRYLSGGVGEQERQSLEQMDGQYNVKLVFATDQGAYISNVDVRIESLDQPQETVLETQTQGPWLFAELPPGRYNVIANYENEEKQETLQVENGLKTAFFQWSR